MPSLNYRNQFASKILDGTKIHTIRRQRKRPIKAGDNLFHFTGQRTVKCIRLLENKCVYAVPIIIRENWLESILVYINKNLISYNEQVRLAKNDGFDDIVDFWLFFKRAGLPLCGQLIGWGEYPGYGGIG